MGFKCVAGHVWGWILSVVVCCDGLCVPCLSLGVMFVNMMMLAMARVGYGGWGRWVWFSAELELQLVMIHLLRDRHPLCDLGCLCYFGFGW
jgi:hypothetical protein